MLDVAKDQNIVALIIQLKVLIFISLSSFFFDIFIISFNFLSFDCCRDEQ